MGAPGTVVGKKPVFLKKTMMKAPDFFKRNFVKLLIVANLAAFSYCSKQESGVERPIQENKIGLMADTPASKPSAKIGGFGAQEETSTAKTIRPKTTRINPELENEDEYFRRIDGNTGLTEREKAVLLEWWILERAKLAGCKTREDSLRVTGFVRLDDSVLYNPTTGSWEVLKSGKIDGRRAYIEEVSERVVVGGKIIRRPPEKAVEEGTEFAPRRRDTLYSKDYPPEAYNYLSKPKKRGDEDLWEVLTPKEKKHALYLRMRAVVEWPDGSTSIRTDTSKEMDPVIINDSIYYDPASNILKKIIPK